MLHPSPSASLPRRPTRTRRTETRTTTSWTCCPGVWKGWWLMRWDWFTGKSCRSRAHVLNPRIKIPDKLELGKCQPPSGALEHRRLSGTRSVPNLRLSRSRPRCRFSGSDVFQAQEVGQRLWRKDFKPNCHYFAVSDTDERTWCRQRPLLVTFGSRDPKEHNNNDDNQYYYYFENNNNTRRDTHDSSIGDALTLPHSRWISKTQSLLLWMLLLPLLLMMMKMLWWRWFGQQQQLITRLKTNFCLDFQHYIPIWERDTAVNWWNRKSLSTLSHCRREIALVKTHWNGTELTQWVLSCT